MLVEEWESFMDSTASAVMILLSCSQGQAVCRPIDVAHSNYTSVDECRTTLKKRLAQSPNGEIVGRCREVDPTVTASVPAGYTTVTVTRGIGNDVQTSSYIVPRTTDYQLAEPERCRRLILSVGRALRPFADTISHHQFVQKLGCGEGLPLRPERQA